MSLNSLLANIPTTKLQTSTGSIDLSYGANESCRTAEDVESIEYRMRAVNCMIVENNSADICSVKAKTMQLPQMSLHVGTSK